VERCLACEADAGGYFVSRTWLSACTSSRTTGSRAPFSQSDTIERSKLYDLPYEFPLLTTGLASEATLQGPSAAACIQNEPASAIGVESGEGNGVTTWSRNGIKRVKSKTWS